MLRTASSPVEIAAKRIVATITYNGQFPGPLLRFKEGQTATVEVHNDTDAPEQLHWLGQMVSTEVDGAAEEGTPFIPARGMRRIVFTPRPSGLRFYQESVAREGMPRTATRWAIGTSRSMAAGWGMASPSYGHNPQWRSERTAYAGAYGRSEEWWQPSGSSAAGT